MIDIFNRPTYAFPAELHDTDRLYEIQKSARRDILNRIEHGYPVKDFLIVFYGGYASNINRRDVTSLRHICGRRYYVHTRLKEMEFKTWMDYRMYKFIPNEDFTYGKIGRPTDMSVERLLAYSTFVPKRKKLALLKKNRIWVNKHKDDPDLIKKRELFKAKVDEAVSMAMSEFQHRQS